MKQIKISEEVKKQLDTMAYDKETYNITIQRIIRENESLKRERQSFMDTTDLLRNIVNKQSEELQTLRQAHNKE